MTKKSNIKVVCAMSGGVDSSVASALLKRAGFDVVGIFMKFWLAPEKNGLQGSWNRCCSPEAEKRARFVASKIGIPFYVLNFEKDFKKKIVDCFLRKHREGVTPNPCVVCNKEVKFGLLLNKTPELGADFIATGHYARIKEGKGGISLTKARDKQKDQSYFLWKLNQKQLKHVLFPVGGYTKTEVKKMAKDFKLPLSGISESQEICFIKTTTSDFLRQYLKKKPGKIIDAQGKVMGEHQGLWFYTIGQRKGIRLPGGPFYVLNKDSKKNLLIVTKKERDLYKKELIFKNVNWISGKKPKLPLRVKAKIRYRHLAASATITKDLKPKTYALKFDKAQKAMTPGQSVVFYRRDEVLGGGIIC